MSHESKKDKNSSIKKIPLKSWEEFEDAIEEEYQSHEELKKSYPKVPNLLFRGQKNACWPLETTLERYVRDKKVTKREYSQEEYLNILKAIKPAINSLANKPEFEKFSNDPLAKEPSYYEFMIYIRHHGFPSPLLDWTRSPYVSGYFAFNDSKDEMDEDVAIYSFLEKELWFKSASSNTPQILGLGSDVVAHKRHYQQQGEYTVCFIEPTGSGFVYGNPNNRIFTSHEKVTFGDSQDFLRKYIIPSTERKKVLRKLDLMNINAFSLFGNEESLMDTLAYQEIEKRR
jgi:hypothetical protein